MRALDRIEEILDLPRDQWSFDQWRFAAESLASQIDGPEPKLKGRPPIERGLRFWSKDANYQALAWQVKGRMDEVREAGKKPIIKKLVREQMHKAWLRHQSKGPALPNFKPMRESRIDEMLPTVYTEVRKLLRKWRCGD